MSDVKNELPPSFLWEATRRWLVREAPDWPASLQEAVERLYRAAEAGHVCITVEGGEALAAEWEATGWVGRPGQYRPFILEERGGRARFYLSRYHQHEAFVARALRERARQLMQPANIAALPAKLDSLFTPDPEDRQRLAALLAQFKALVLVSGGPGTGKTTTVVKMLALLQRQALTAPDDKACALRILLAAPTGKAAQRLSESLREAKEKLGLLPEVAAAIPETAQTLHRLLGAEGDTGRFRHGIDNPLACDLLLVDEASMIDLALMQAVLAALPPTSRLVLLGDRDQLASVEAGSVFGDLCVGGGMSAAMAAELALFGVAIPAADAREASSVLADCRVELTRSYRFAPDSGIARLARAARVGDDAEFRAALQAQPDLETVAATQLAARMKAGYAPYREAAKSVTDKDGIAAAFRAFAGFRVLAAHRQGRFGLEGLNAVMEQGSPLWYAGRPVIVRANDPALRLFNGDIGLCLPGEDGLRVFFEAGPGEYRAFAPGRVPRHESAWAMTVHQSQGSEFDTVLLVLPEQPSPVQDRPLVYTAVTRAKTRFAFCGSASVLSAALATLPKRESGLVEKLQE